MRFNVLDLLHILLKYVFILVNNLKRSVKCLKYVLRRSILVHCTMQRRCLE